MKKISILLVLVIVMSLAFTGCNSSNNEQPKEPQVEDNNNETVVPEGEIEITGLEGGDVVISVSDIYGMESATEKMTNISSSGEVVEAEVTGVKIDTILSQYNVFQKDFEGIRFFAGDGYSIIVPKEILEKKEIMLIFKQDGQPLLEKHMPLRVAVPDERSMYWVGNVVGMEIVNTEIINITKVVILESAYELLTQEDYTYYETVDKAVKTEELFGKFSSETETDEIAVKCADGLKKDEKKEVFLTGYIKTTGEYAPMFLSPELPKGMYLKELLSFVNGENAFFSIEQGLVVYTDELKTVEDDQGLPLTSIEDSIGLKKGKLYKLTAVDGYSTEISREDFEKGIIYPRNKGGYSTAFEGLPKNTKVKGIVSIEVIDNSATDESAVETSSNAISDESAKEEKSPIETLNIIINGTEFTKEDAKEIEFVTVTINKKDKEGNLKPAEWQGLRLKDVLEAAGVKEFSTVTLAAADGFSVDITKEVVDAETTLLGFVHDGEALSAEDTPRLTVEGEGSNVWIRGIATIETK